MIGRVTSDVMVISSDIQFPSGRRPTLGLSCGRSARKRRLVRFNAFIIMAIFYSPLYFALFASHQIKYSLAANIFLLIFASVFMSMQALLRARNLLSDL